MNNSTYHVPYLAQLVEHLDDVVLKQVGPNIINAIRRIRQLALERRAGMPDAELRLIEELNRLDEDDAHDIIRAFTMYFDLANLAEELNRIRALRRRSRTAVELKNRRQETIFDAIAAFKQQGLSASDVQSLVSRLRIEPVFTAHPSEAKRRTTRQILRRLRETLNEISRTDPESDRMPHFQQLIHADLTNMWQSDLLRPHRPTVMSEVKRGLFFANVLWKVVPQILQNLRDALAEHYPQFEFTLPPMLRFGTWIGGDRDGHPFVTTETTSKTLDILRQTAINGHLKQCHHLMGILVMSDRHTTGLDPIKKAVAEARAAIPELEKRLTDVSESEACRQWLKIIEYRLLLTQGTEFNQNDNSGNAYNTAQDFENDVSLLVNTLMNCGSSEVVETSVRPWLDTIHSFGLHFASMDIRQHSSVHTSVIAEMFKQAGICDDFEAADSDERSKLLLKTLNQPVEYSVDKLSDTGQELIALFDLLASRVQREGLSTFGAYVISMTNRISDILSVMWLWSQAWQRLKTKQPLPSLPISPLFETIEDLENAPGIMDALWRIPEYRSYLQRNGNAPSNSESHEVTQMVMIGYSDSTKDGGYLSACWKLQQAQTRLAELAKRNGTRLIIFHGRGGALGRGGGPAARAVLSLPPTSVDCAMRVTEQGEILAERYDDPEIAFRHLEQVSWATLLVSGETNDACQPEYESALSSMADVSLAAYQELVRHPEFLTYFDLATPVSEIETLPIGSRPARRGSQRSLSNLRAIPWIFAWTQSRHLVPAWYGLGTAIRQFVDNNNDDWSLLREMYKKWRFFSATIHNAELALAKADIDIAHCYSELCGEENGEAIWKMIREEYERSRAAILMIKQQNELLEGTGWLQRGIAARNPSVDPLNFLQIRMLNESRSSSLAVDSEEEMSISHILRLTINGIAAGLRTTG